MRFSSVNYAKSRQRTTVQNNHSSSVPRPNAAHRNQQSPSRPPHQPLVQPASNIQQYQQHPAQRHPQAQTQSQPQPQIQTQRRHQPPSPQTRQPQSQPRPQSQSQSRSEIRPQPKPQRPQSQSQRQPHPERTKQTESRPQSQPQLQQQPQQWTQSQLHAQAHSHLHPSSAATRPHSTVHPNTPLQKQTRPHQKPPPSPQRDPLPRSEIQSQRLPPHCQPKQLQPQPQSQRHWPQPHARLPPESQPKPYICTTSQQEPSQVRPPKPQSPASHLHARSQPWLQAQRQEQVQPEKLAQCSKSQISPLKPPLPPTSTIPRDYLRSLASTTRDVSPSTSKDSMFHVRRNARVHFRPSLYTYLSLVLIIILILLRHSYRSSLLTSLMRQNVRIPNEPRHALRLHIFAAPKPYVGPDRLTQLRALESWLSLTPTPEVTLLGDSPSVRAIARKYRLQLEERIETTFLGVPLLNSVLEVIINRTTDRNVTSSKSSNSRKSQTITVFLNADIILFDDFVLSMRKLRASYNRGRPWLAVAARWDIPSLSSFLPVNGPRKRNADKLRVSAAAYVRVHGTLRTFGGVDLWAWEQAPSFGIVPPFALGRGRYDNWLTHILIRSGSHEVVDISEAVTLAHVRHLHALSGGAIPESLEGGEDEFEGQEFWSVQARRGFETVINALLAASAHGEYRPQMGTVLHAPRKLTSCHESIPLCLFVRRRPHECRCEHSAFVMRAHNDPYVVSGSNVVFCGLLSSNFGAPPLDERTRWAITGRVTDRGEDVEPEGDEENEVEAKIFGMPLTRKDVLSTIGNRTGTDTIILIIADYSERMLVMQTVCSMRNTHIFQWLVVVALDDDMYRFCLLQGLAVYLVDYDDSGISNHLIFRQLARLQSVFEILRRRRHTIFSIYPGSTFITSPWPYLNHFVDPSYDVAFLPSDNFTSNAHASAAALFVRPTNAAMNLLKVAMTEIERNTSTVQYAGQVLWNMACGPNGEQLSRRMRRTCEVKYSAKTYLMDITRFRSVAAPTCPKCSKWNAGAPIMLLPYRMGQQDEDEKHEDEENKVVSQLVKGSGFSAYEDGHCIWL